MPPWTSVLHGLKRADRASELHALLRVGDGALEITPLRTFGKEVIPAVAEL